MEPVPFNRGFYSVDMTFFFNICVDVFCPLATSPCIVNGVSIFSKRVILYGSEGNVKMFSSDCTQEDLIVQNSRCGDVLPKATCQVAEPICLSARICDCQSHCNEACCQIPDCICRQFGGQLDFSSNRSVYVTIGIFTIVQIVRNVQMLIPAYDFCIPEKECVTSSDDPCDMFRRIEFPTEEFFPPKVSDCGCNSDRPRR
ncbi:hypothetical protein [Caproiciproducens galactitolivorans]|nr:hypothetical protein [Caproiciproducens galactitolivorans]